jgi:hypothetical protein
MASRIHIYSRANSGSDSLKAGTADPAADI